MFVSKLSVPSSLALLLLTLAACSGGGAETSAPDPSGSGTGSSDDVAQDEAASSTPSATPTSPAPTTPTTPPTPTGCNVIVNDASAIGAQMVAAVAPAAEGGPIPSGTFHLTDITLYTGPKGSAGPLALSIKQTIAIKGTTVDVAEETNGKIDNLTEQLTINGTEVAMDRVCPSALPGKTGSYTATGTSFVLFLLNDLNQTVAYTYAP